MLQHIATYRNRVAKRTQHVVPNNVARCCVEMLRAFGQVLTLDSFWEIAVGFVSVPKIEIGFSFSIPVFCLPAYVQTLFITLDGFWEIAVGVVSIPKIEIDISFSSPVACLPVYVQTLFITVDSFCEIAVGFVSDPKIVIGFSFSTASLAMFKCFSCLSKAS